MGLDKDKVFLIILVNFWSQMAPDELFLGAIESDVADQFLVTLVIALIFSLVELVRCLIDQIKFSFLEEDGKLKGVVVFAVFGVALF